MVTSRPLRTVEDLLDQYGLTGTLTLVVEQCQDRAYRLIHELDDQRAARRWERAATIIETCAAKTHKLNL